MTHVLAFKDSLGNPVREIGRADAWETVVLTLSREQACAIEKYLGFKCLTSAECEMFPGILEQIAHERDALAGE